MEREKALETAIAQLEKQFGRIQQELQIMTKPLVAVVVGPTASGKSALAVEIAKDICYNNIFLVKDIS